MFEQLDKPVLFVVFSLSCRWTFLVVGEREQDNGCVRASWVRGCRQDKSFASELTRFLPSPGMYFSPHFALKPPRIRITPYGANTSHLPIISPASKLHCLCQRAPMPCKGSTQSRAQGAPVLAYGTGGYGNAALSNSLPAPAISHTINSPRSGHNQTRSSGLGACRFLNISPAGAFRKGAGNGLDYNRDLCLLDISSSL